MNSERQGPRDTGMHGNVTPSALLGHQNVLNGMAFLLFVLCLMTELLSNVVSPGRDTLCGDRRQITTPTSKLY